MPGPAIFLDDGGVMNDNRLRGAQWYRMVAEFFVQRLGGAPEDWAEANARVMTRMLDAVAWQARLDASPDYASFDRRYHVDWLRWMCDLVGVPAPSDEECIALARDAYRSITPRVRAAFPGAVTAIRALHRRGYTLHTASGESSEDLDCYLRGMGVRGASVACTGRTSSMPSSPARDTTGASSPMPASHRMMRWWSTTTPTRPAGPPGRAHGRC